MAISTLLMLISRKWFYYERKLERIFTNDRFSSSARYIADIINRILDFPLRGWSEISLQEKYQLAHVVFMHRHDIH